MRKNGHVSFIEMSRVFCNHPRLTIEVIVGDLLLYILDIELQYKNTSSVMDVYMYAI